MIKIGCLGPQGTFSELALENYMEEKPYEKVLVSSIPELINAVDIGSVDMAMVPIENSLEGGVNTTLDCLASSLDLLIVGEFLFKVHQNLLSNSNSNEITKIFSHPQAIGQCALFLKNNYPSVPIEFTASTAMAAKLAADNPKYAAIGSKSLSDIYSLKITSCEIEDNSLNITRFIIVSKTQATATNYDKTSIVFGVEDKPGSLFKILSIFDVFGINMMKIESRPAKTKLGEYLFFVDVDGNTNDVNIKKALDIVEYKASFFRNLGSYKKAILK